MAPTRCKLQKTNVGEEVLDLVIPYIHDVDDRNSVSLVSPKFYEIDGITRKRLTVHVLYYPNPNPASLSKRFPFMDALTLKGGPSYILYTYPYNIQITPWIKQLALEFRYLKELHIRHLVIHDGDLETLARTRGKDLRSLKIKKCRGFSTDGLMHVSKYCNQLRTLCLDCCYQLEVKDGIWLHQLALNSTVLERLHLTYGYGDISLEKYIKLLAKNCCNSLISLKIGMCYLSKLGDAFRYAFRLEHFSGMIFDEEESKFVSFQLPPSMCSLSIKHMTVTRYSIVLPLLNHIRKLKLTVRLSDNPCQCLLFKNCPNLEVLYTKDECGDRGLQVIAEFCKKLRKLTHIDEDEKGLVTHVGLIALVKGCTNLECLDVTLGDISNEALECLGMHLKNLRKFRMRLAKKDGTTNPPLDNGIRAMVIGCSKLEKLDISLMMLSICLSRRCRHGCRHGGWTDVGLEYIGKYGTNLRSLSLTRIGNSDEGLMKLSEGCPNLRKLKLIGSPFSEQLVTSSVFNTPSLRYVWFDNASRRSHTVLGLIRPEFHL